MAEDLAQQQALMDAGIFPMAEVSPDDNLLQGPETQPPLQGPENRPLYGPETQPPLQGPSTQIDAEIDEAFKFNELLNAHYAQQQVYRLNEEMAADLPTAQSRGDALSDLADLVSLYKVTGDENTLDDLYSSDYNNPAMVKADISRMMRGFTQAQQDLQMPAGPLLMPSVTGQSLQDQMGAEEYLRALAINQQKTQQQEMQQLLLNLMRQPF